jgi:hypothetical protein
MSGINGDKARFNKERKKKIARRLRNDARFHGKNAEQPAASTRVAKTKPVSA